MFSRKSMCAGLLLTVCPGAHAQEWTEQALLDIFDRQSPIRREAQAAAASAMEAVRGRTLWPNPTAAYSRETAGFTEFYVAEQQLPLSGRLRFEKQALEPAREALAAQGDARLWDARSSLRAAFYRALSAQLQADALRESLTNITGIIELLAVREREGETARYDRVRVEREAADLRADIALAAARARSEQAALAAHLPRDIRIASLRGDLLARMIPASPEEIVRRALESRAEVRAESRRVEQLAFEEQAADRLRLPEPVVTGGVKRTQVLGNRNDTGAVFGVSIPLPLFNKGRTEVARLSAEQSQARARQDLLSQQIAAAVLGAFDVYRARVDALNAFERETRTAGDELQRTARVGYEEGELGILQLLDAYRIERQTALRRLELESAVKEIEIELSRNAGYEVTQ